MRNKGIFENIEEKWNRRLIQRCLNLGLELLGHYCVEEWFEIGLLRKLCDDDHFGVATKNQGRRIGSEDVRHGWSKILNLDFVPCSRDMDSETLCPSIADDGLQRERRNFFILTIRKFCDTGEIRLAFAQQRGADECIDRISMIFQLRFGFCKEQISPLALFVFFEGFDRIITSKRWIVDDLEFTAFQYLDDIILWSDVTEGNFDGVGILEDSNASGLVFLIVSGFEYAARIFGIVFSIISFKATLMSIPPLRERRRVPSFTCFDPSTLRRGTRGFPFLCWDTEIGPEYLKSGSIPLDRSLAMTFARLIETRCFFSHFASPKSFARFRSRSNAGFCLAILSSCSVKFWANCYDGSSLFSGTSASLSPVGDDESIVSVR